MLLLLHQIYLDHIEPFLYCTKRLNSADQFQLLCHMLLVLHLIYLSQKERFLYRSKHLNHVD